MPPTALAAPRMPSVHLVAVFIPIDGSISRSIRATLGSMLGVSISRIAIQRTAAVVDPAQALYQMAGKLSATLPVCNGDVDCNNLGYYESGQTAYESIVFPGFAQTAYGLLVPIPAFADVTQPIAISFSDANADGLVPAGTISNTQRSKIFAAWQDASKAQIALWIKSVRDSAAQNGTAGYAAQNGYLVGQRQGIPFAVPDPANVSLKTFLANVTTFALTYADLATGVAPTVAEQTQPGGFLSYVARVGYLWWIPIVSGQVPLIKTGITGCLGGTGSWCLTQACGVSDQWPKGMPICTQPIDFNHDPDTGIAISWNLFLSRDKVGVTTARFELIPPTTWDRIANQIAEIAQVATSIVCGVVAPGASASANPYAKGGGAVLSKVCSSAAAPVVVPVPSAQAPIVPPPPPAAQTSSPWPWIAAGVVAASATGAYFFLRR